MFRGMDMNGKKSGKNTNGKKKFPIGWILPVAALTFFLGHFWSYIPVVRGVVSLFVLSKILTGTAPGAFLL
jgi:hypothetical protein